jgi:hypothetical protein
MLASRQQAQEFGSASEVGIHEARARYGVVAAFKAVLTRQGRLDLLVDQCICIEGGTPGTKPLRRKYRCRIEKRGDSANFLYLDDIIHMQCMQ